MEMYCYFPDTELAIPAKSNMKNSIVFVTFSISVVVYVVTIYRDIVEVETRILVKTAHDRLSNSVIECCGALDVHVLVTVIELLCQPGHCLPLHPEESHQLGVRLSLQLDHLCDAVSCEC